MYEKCGLFGIYSQKTYKGCIEEVISGLQLLQHRGQEGCGISYNISGELNVEKGLGLVDKVFGKGIHYKETDRCIGHVRYSTSGKSNNYEETQPLIGNTDLGKFSLAHNGNIPKIKGHDTKYLVDFLEKDKGITWKERIIHLLETIPGAYCLLILVNNEIYAVRDRFGIRPLCIGFNNNDICISSESVALHKFNHLMDVNPGEIFKLGEKGLEKIYSSQRVKLSICAFEFIYFLRPNSYSDGYYVSDVRKKFGLALANNEDYIFDSSYKVVGVPNSGIISARSYAIRLNLIYDQLILRNKKINRTFILPSEEERQRACKEKFIFKEDISGNKIIVVDDTIVRGNVMKLIVSEMWKKGATEVHVRIPAPPVISKCQFGIDIPTETELLAHNRSIDQIGELLNVTSLRYLKCSDLDNIIPKDSYKECFNGKIDIDLIEW